MDAISINRDINVHKKSKKMNMNKFFPIIFTNKFYINDTEHTPGNAILIQDIWLLLLLLFDPVKMPKILLVKYGTFSRKFSAILLDLVNL